MYILQTIESSSFHAKVPSVKSWSKKGFTLIELLVAMTILVIITLMVARIFQQAGVAWDTGSKKAETTMKGRAIADYIAQELSNAVFLPDHPGFSASGQNADFWMLGDADAAKRGPRHVQYAGIKRTVTYLPSGSDSGDLADTVKTVDFYCAGLSGSNLPPVARITVTITDSKGIDYAFTSTAYLQNRDRYRY